MKIKIIFLTVLFLIPIVFSISESNVNFEVQKGRIAINVNTDESFSNIIEFTVNGESQVSTFDNCPNGVCSGSRAKIINFDSINIYNPGNYSFTITPIQGNERITKNFNLEITNLYSCEYNNEIIRNNQCFFDATENLEDKGLKCLAGNQIDRCTECGCPSENYLCCTNENLEECIGNLGRCVLPKDRGVVVNITEGEDFVGVETTEGYYLNGVLIPNGVCVNNVITDLRPSDSLFAMQATCSVFDADLDKDGFDSNEFVGGRDCNDKDALINPRTKESCDDETGYDGIDNNCDGVVDLDCSSSCDVDGDRYYSVNAGRYLSLFCTVLGFSGGDCDDNNAVKFEGNEEICEDLIDNNCNNIIDDSNVCVCKIGDQRKYGKVRNDGIEECADGKNWEVVKEANENPLVFINTQQGSIESGDVNLNVGEEFEIEVKFLCPNGDCDVEVN